MHVYVVARQGYWMSSSIFLLQFFCFVLCILRQCLFTEPEVHVSIRLSVKQPLGSTFVYTPVLGLQTPMAAPDFDMGGGDQNADPPVCVASALPTKSSSQTSLPL